MKRFYGKSYHKYFEGYTEFQVPNRNGMGKHIERVYTEAYYRRNLTDKEWKKQRFHYRICYFGALAAFLAAELCPAQSNKSVYLVFPSMLSVLGFLWLSYTFFPFTLAKREMKIREYRNRMNVVASSILTAVFMALGSLGAIAFLATQKPESIIWEILCAGLFLGGTLFLFHIHFNEKKAEYIQIKNERKVAGEGYDIRLARE